VMCLVRVCGVCFCVASSAFVVYGVCVCVWYVCVTCKYLWCL